MASTSQPGEKSPLSRRAVLRGGAAGGLTLPVLAACGAGDGGATSPSPSAADGGPLVRAADVPVGGGTVLAQQQVVVTQPAEGEFKAFSAVCTHQSCLVGSVSDGQIRCPCHGSLFSIEDGSPLGGPALDPLPEVRVTVEDGEVLRG